MIAYDAFRQEKDKLFLGEEFLGSLVPHTDKKDMFYIKQANGVVSVWYGNWTRAWDNFKRQIMFERNASSIQSTMAEKPVLRARTAI